MRTRRLRSSVAVAALTLFVLTGCGAAQDPASPAAGSVSGAGTGAENAVPAGDGSPVSDAGYATPAWASPISIRGAQIASLDLGEIGVDIYQAGIARASEDSRMTDPETGAPVVAAGDRIVFLNYVFTNEGDPVDLGISLGEVKAHYAGGPELTRMSGITDDDLYARFGLSERGYDSANPPDGDVYTLGADESFNYAVNLPYRAGSTLVLEAELTPVDAAGDPLIEERLTARTEVTID